MSSMSVNTEAEKENENGQNEQSNNDTKAVSFDENIGRKKKALKRKEEVKDGGDQERGGSKFTVTEARSRAQNKDEEKKPGKEELDFEGDTESESDEDIIEEGDEEEDEEGEDDDVNMDGQQPTTRVYRHGIDELGEDEVLEHDPQAYEMLHCASSDWPCLSLDVVSDKLGDNRTKYPMTTYLVAGTQADRSDRNRIIVMKWSQLSRTEKDEEDSDIEEGSDSDDETMDPRFEYRVIPHHAAINRIRAMPQGPVVSIWSEDGKVHVYSTKKELEVLDNPTIVTDFKPKPLHTFDGHLDEGFALAWNPHKESMGQMLSGDGRGAVAHWKPREFGWDVELLSSSMHKSSVEDVAWKLAGNGCPHTWASASVDQHVNIWDVRQSSTKPEVNIHAHETDVNVLSWNPKQGDLILTGADDGAFKIFDIRNPSPAMAHFQWHKDQITSVEWHPTDETTLAISSADGAISIWDVAVEDDMEGAVPEGAEHFPPQLLFLHQGQENPKEIKWHPQIPGVLLSTGSNGFNIFKACNM